MAVYFLCDVMDRITEIINDGSVFADISELPSDGVFSSCLMFSTPAPNVELLNGDYGTIDPISEGDPCSAENKACYAFTPAELSTIKLALDNALEYFNECLDNKEGLYTRDTLDEIKSSSVSCRNLQAKVGKILNRF